MRVALVLLAVVALNACSDKAPTKPSPIAKEVTLAPGQTASVAEASIRSDLKGSVGTRAARAMPFASPAAMRW